MTQPHSDLFCTQCEEEQDPRDMSPSTPNWCQSCELNDEQIEQSRMAQGIG